MILISKRRRRENVYQSFEDARVTEGYENARNIP